MSEKIVITGMGAVTPVGIGVDNFWSGLIEGRTGIGDITTFDASMLPVRFAGEVRDFVPKEYMPRKLSTELDRFAQFAMIAADEALTDSKLEITDENAARIGIVMATSLSGVMTFSETQSKHTLAPEKKVGPRFLPKYLGNVAAAQISIRFGIKGPSMTVSTACSSGGDAMTLGRMMLQSNMADVVVVAGGEAGAIPILVSSLNVAGALSTRNDAPDKACRPFDKDRDGFVIGEGGGAVILETESHAKARGASVHAYIAGAANNTDAYHVTAPSPDGSGAAACMKLAFEDSGLSPADIGYINAHGTSTHAGDVAETTAIKKAFGDAAGSVSISSTKGATGHMMGAGGITEAIACVKVLQTGIMPPTLNLEDADPECDLDYVPLKAREKEMDFAMSNSFGFGGQNSCVIVGKYK